MNELELISRFWMVKDKNKQYHRRRNNHGSKKLKTSYLTKRSTLQKERRVGRSRVRKSTDQDSDFCISKAQIGGVQPVDRMGGGGEVLIEKIDANCLNECGGGRWRRGRAVGVIAVRRNLSRQKRIMKKRGSGRSNKTIFFFLISFILSY